MADARVDKAWVARGLKDYPTEAILGTLRHYGAEADEATFKKLAQDKFPIGIAELWHKNWKGTGQFSKFPAAAAEELWHRLEGDRLTPLGFAEAIRDLMLALSKMLDGEVNAPVGKGFARVDELKPRVPLQDGKPRRDFMLEVAALMGKAFEAFNHVSDALAKAGHVDDAESFALVEEFMFPERAGVTVAGVKALSGKKPEAIEDLKKIAADSGRGFEGRLAAIDGLLIIDAHEPGGAAALTLLDDAEKEKDFHLAFDAARRYGHALEKLGKRAELNKLAERIEKLGEAHRAAHPDHDH